MPSGNHLKWHEIADFTAGLWEVSDDGATVKQGAPPNAMSLLTDYRPMHSGGLRAFVKGRRTLPGVATAASNGIGSGETITGIFSQGGVTTRTGKGGGSLLNSAARVDSQIIYAVTIDRSSFKARVRRLDLSNDSTSWAQLYVDSVAHTTANHAPATWGLFQEVDGDIYVVTTIVAGGARGLYKIGYAEGASGTGIDGDTDFVTGKNGPVAIHQARVLVAGQTGAEPDLGQEAAKIYYTDDPPGTLAFADGNYVQVDPNHASGGAIAVMSPIEPGDLIVGKTGAPWATLSGDITSANLAIRDMGNEHHPRKSQQQAPQVPGGIAFIEPGGRVIVTDGRNFAPISDMLDVMPASTGASGAARSGPGQLQYGNGLLFGPRGMVYDFETKAWFRQTGLPSAMSWVYDAHFGEMIGAGMNIGETAWDGTTVNTANSVGVFPMFPDSTDDYSPTGEFATQPFNDANGRNVSIREVQVFHRPHRTGTTMTVTLQDSAGTTVGSAVTRTLGTSGVSAMASFLFPGYKKPYLKVKVTVDSGGAAAAATIERVRIGFDGNNSLSLTAA